MSTRVHVLAAPTPYLVSFTPLVLLIRENVTLCTWEEQLHFYGWSRERATVGGSPSGLAQCEQRFRAGRRLASGPGHGGRGCARSPCAMGGGPVLRSCELPLGPEVGGEQRASPHPRDAHTQPPCASPTPHRSWEAGPRAAVYLTTLFHTRIVPGMQSKHINDCKENTHKAAARWLVHSTKPPSWFSPALGPAGPLWVSSHHLVSPLAAWALMKVGGCQDG